MRAVAARMIRLTGFDNLGRWSRKPRRTEHEILSLPQSGASSITSNSDLPDDWTNQRETKPPTQVGTENQYYKYLYRGRQKALTEEVFATASELPSRLIGH